MSAIPAHPPSTSGLPRAAVTPVTGPEAELVIGRLPGTIRAYALPDGSGEHVLVGHQVATVIARGSDTGDLFQAVVLTGGTGAAMPPHRHAQAHEAVFVLDGQVELRLGDATHLLSRGDYASIPPGTLHGHVMRSHRTRLLSWTMGGDAGAMYAAMGTAFPRPVPPDQEGAGIDAAQFAQAEAAADVMFDHAAASPGLAAAVAGDTIPLSRAPYVLRSGEGERLVAADQLFTFLGTQANSDGRFITVMTAGPAGDMIPPHFHAAHTENFLCLDGLMTMVVNGQELHLHPGDFLQVPPRHVHAYRLDAPYTRFMGWLTPGLFEPFFRLIGEPCNAYEFPLRPSAPRFDRVIAKLDQLDLFLLPPGRTPPAGTPL